MSGKWVKVVPYDRCREYTCAKPSISKKDYSIGSVWECECGQRWVISKWNDDQRDGPWPTWVKVPPILPRG
jgi:hypothetical protein